MVLRSSGDWPNGVRLIKLERQPAWPPRQAGDRFTMDGWVR